MRLLPRSAAAALALALLAPTLAWAQPPLPVPPTCEDQLRESRVALQATTLSQVRDRGDAAREIVQLQRRIEALAAEAARLAAEVKALKAKAVPEPEKK